MRRIANPPNRFVDETVEWLGRPPDARLEVYEEQAKSILSRNDSPDLPFRYSLNPYRGCYHACAYCYARATHPYWGFGAGTDFDRKIVVKVNAVEKLRQVFEGRAWKGSTILFSGNTDCYQPLEASYALTRGCLELCLEYGNPVLLITKSRLIVRDLDLLAALARRAAVRVHISIPFSDDGTSKLIEPNASVTSRRFDALEALAGAGIDCGIAVAPIIPGLNDRDIPDLLTRARDAGARRAFMTAVHVAGEPEQVFRERLREAMPDRVVKIETAIRSIRDGRFAEARVGRRMVGTGDRWAVIEKLFQLHCDRLGLRTGEEDPPEGSFRRPTPQMALF